MKKNDKNWKLKPKQKVYVIVYAVLFVLFAVIPSIVLDIYYLQQTTAFETGKVISFIGFCLVSDIVVWGAAATIILMLSVVVMLLIKLVTFIIDTARGI